MAILPLRYVNNFKKGKFMIKIMVISAFVLGLSATVGMAQDIGGHYAVAGTNINGSPYAGEAMVTLTSDTTCEIEWITGDVSSYGICMRHDNAFATGYQLGDAVGLGIYLVQQDGSLIGTWTVAGQEGSGTEVLTPM